MTVVEAAEGQADERQVHLRNPPLGEAMVRGRRWPQHGWRRIRKSGLVRRQRAGRATCVDLFASDSTPVALPAGRRWHNAGSSVRTCRPAARE